MLDYTFLVLATYAIVQVIVKPLIVAKWLNLQQDNPNQDNITRALGFLVAYALTLINAATAPKGLMSFSEAWTLLPTAAAIYAASAAAYHITTPSTAVTLRKMGLEPNAPDQLVQLLTQNLAALAAAAPQAQVQPGVDGADARAAFDQGAAASAAAGTPRGGEDGHIHPTKAASSAPASAPKAQEAAVLSHATVTPATSSANGKESPDDSVHMPPDHAQGKPIQGAEVNSAEQTQVVPANAALEGANRPGASSADGKVEAHSQPSPANAVGPLLLSNLLSRAASTVASGATASRLDTAVS